MGFVTVFPKTLALGFVELLNFAVPITLARQVDAFGPWIESERCSDWYVLERCMKELPVVWRQLQPPCAARF